MLKPKIDVYAQDSSGFSIYPPKFSSFDITSGLVNQLEPGQIIIRKSISPFAIVPDTGYVIGHVYALTGECVTINDKLITLKQGMTLVERLIPDDNIPPSIQNSGEWIVAKNEYDWYYLIGHTKPHLLKKFSKDKTSEYEKYKPEEFLEKGFVILSSYEKACVKHQINRHLRGLSHAIEDNSQVRTMRKLEENAN